MLKITKFLVMNLVGYKNFNFQCNANSNSNCNFLTHTLYFIDKNFFEKLLTKTYPCYSLGKDKLVICVSAWFLSKDCLSKYPLFLGSSLICRNQSPGSEMIKGFFRMGRLEKSTGPNLNHQPYILSYIQEL